jgi:beta-lactam-binding protein with PASTA domain
MTARRNTTALSDRYELADKLGAGGMAEVYLGRDRVLGRTVAVKTLLDQHAGDPHFIERFRREAQNAASLNHPNVVSVYDTGADGNTQYIVMEYVEGRTLREVIREEGPLLPERAAEIAADVCAGLSFAHQHGIVHRDVKPANIMVTPAGIVKVADFGIARAVSGETVTQTAMVLGTAQYFSPEQAQSAAVDARSDIYSLGVVLYEMLTRQVPFTGSSPVAIAYKHVKEAPMLPSRINPDVPPGLEAIVIKALAKNPSNRYQSAEEMRQDLLRYLQGGQVVAEPVLSDATGMIDALSDETMLVDRVRATRAVGFPLTPEQRRRRTGFILIGIIGTAIAAVTAWAILGLVGGSATGAVPKVVGTEMSAATERLQAAGFKVRFAPGVYSDTAEAGTVAAQDPVPGTKINKARDFVTLTPSKGTHFVAVPDVVGKSDSEARRLLLGAGFKIGKITHQTNADVPYGRVISQSVNGNAEFGSSVDLVESNGAPSATVTNVIGLPYVDACNRLAGDGFDCQPIEEAVNPSCSQPEGHVCRESPDAGEHVAYGSRVTVTYAGPPDQQPSDQPTETSTPTETPTP